MVIYTDGACLGNPGPGGWAALFLDTGRVWHISGAEKQTTNNRMELMAAIRALQEVPINTEVTLYTDSQYVKQGITIWISSWKKRQWRRSDNNPVKNVDLWMLLDEAAAQRKVNWQWVKAHSGHEHNEIVDQLARDQAILVAQEQRI